MRELFFYCVGWIADLMKLRLCYLVLVCLAILPMACNQQVPPTNSVADLKDDSDSDLTADPAVTFPVESNGEQDDGLTIDQIFPVDRVIDIEITVEEKDWNTIRFQRRDMETQFAPERQFGEIEGPYTYVPAKFVIDGVEFPQVAIRKKGLLGSQSTVRPSLKIKLNYYDKDAEIGGLNLLTLNNNRQDSTQMSQFMGYALFNKVGSPAPRCAFAQVKLNGKNLGVYSHVESAKKALVERAFGNSDGTLFEGTVVDFDPDWEKSFDRKFGDEKSGHAKLKAVSKALTRPEGIPILTSTATGRGMVPTDGDLQKSWTQLDFDDSSWTSGRNGAGYESNSGFENAISPEFDFLERMHRKATSVYLRFPFTVDELEQLDAGKLFLMMKYDDGFVAYLNGQQLVSTNVPSNPKWDTAAHAAQGDQTGMRFQPFDISDQKDKFRIGNNVLAIHGMNSDADSTDLLFVARIETNNFEIGDGLDEIVDLDAFYRFWAMESLLGFWDGYTANRNNFFIYVNSQTDKIHFMPWGGDCMFQKLSYIDRNPLLPLSVKVKGQLNYALYQTQAGRDRYRQTLISLLENDWDEETLLAEVDRLEELLRPHLSKSQERSFRLERLRRFIRDRRSDLLEEIEDGMPIWPPVVDASNSARQ